MKQEYTYQIGFNYGYLLSKYNHAFFAKLAPCFIKRHDFIIGLSDGNEEYELEILKSKVLEIDNLRNQEGRDFGREL